MINIPSSIKIASGIQMLTRVAHRWHKDFIKSNLFLRNKESRLKYKLSCTSLQQKDAGGKVSVFINYETDRLKQHKCVIFTWTNCHWDRFPPCTSVCFPILIQLTALIVLSSILPTSSNNYSKKIIWASEVKLSFPDTVNEFEDQTDYSKGTKKLQFERQCRLWNARQSNRETLRI
jgi:hypothetical protein